ncbi:MAG: sodium-dependent transporter [Candidatus Latescibacteria bacterium]|jgi:neurotransmitter:Na+ symporter, NSS family|nr:sodium-dependent transporter [Candidatus Latescibacterota bacterium]
MSDDPEREVWQSRLGLIFAMAGNAVGLGNFLRFPVQAASNGGGAFMIPYFVAFLLLGIPMMWVEWSIGRYGGKKGHGTTPGIFFHLWDHPAAKYIGVLGIALPAAFAVYYSFIQSWTLAYSYFSLSGSYFGITSQEEMMLFLSSYQGVTTSQFFNGLGSAYVFFIINLLVVTWVLARGIVRGIETLAKFAMPLLFIFALVLVVRVFTLGAPDPTHPEQSVMAGFAFIWNPDFSQLTNGSVWLAAAGQIFFSLGIGIGSMQTYASYLRAKEDIALTGLTTSMSNGFAEVVLGSSIAIPVAVAFFGISATQAIANGGSYDLGFASMPLIFQRLPLGQVFGTLWFGLLFIAGITSTVALTQTTMAFLQDEMNWTRIKAALTVGAVLFLGGNFVLFYYVHGVVNEFDFWVGTVGLVVFSTVEVIIYGWIFGMENAWKEITEGAAIHIPRIFFYIIKYVTPALLIILLGIWVWQAGLDIFLLRNANPDDLPFLWAARALICSLVVIGVILVAVVSKRWQRSPVAQSSL